MANFVGTAGNDVYVGTAFNDTFDLSQGGNDRAFGSDGGDTFTMGAELGKHDRIDGGFDYDSVNIAGNYHLVFLPTTMVNVEDLRLAAGYNYHLTLDDATVARHGSLFVAVAGGTGKLVFDGSAETDGAFSIEAADGDDRLTGGAGDDSFNGRGGTNVLKGGAGDDLIISGGTDTIDGGDGTDEVRLERSGATANLTFDLHDFGDVTELVGDGTTVTNAENFILYGGTGNDDFSTLGGTDSLNGGAGNDTIHSGGGNDNIAGGSGTNALFSGSGDDSVFSNGIDTINGGDGADVATLERSSSLLGLTFHFVSPSQVTTLGDGTTVTNVETFNLIGGIGDDDFVTGSGNDYLEGGGGTNTLIAGHGDDQIGSSGTDTVDGGAGDDRIDNSKASSIDGGGGEDYLKLRPLGRDIRPHL